MSQLLLLNLIDYLYYFKIIKKSYQIHLYNMKCAGHLIVFLFIKIVYFTNTTSTHPVLSRAKTSDLEGQTTIPSSQ